MLMGNTVNQEDDRDGNNTKPDQEVEMVAGNPVLQPPKGVKSSCEAIVQHELFKIYIHFTSSG